MKCVDPLVAWIRLVRQERTEVGFRVQLTCFLTSTGAKSVWVKHMRLRLRVDGEEHVMPWNEVAEFEGQPYPLSAGYGVTNSGPEHVVVDFSSDDRELVASLRMPDPPVKATLEALLDDASNYRKIASYDFVLEDRLVLGGGWRKVTTNRT